MTKRTREVDRYYWDACVFLSLIEGTKDRLPIIDAILDDCQNGRIEICTSVLSITEVAFGKAEKDGKAIDPSTEEKIDKLWTPPSPIKVIEFHELMAYDAKALIRKGLRSDWRLKSADAIHLVTAKRMGVAEFHTYDSKLMRYAPDLGFTIREPDTDRKLLLPPDDDET